MDKITKKLNISKFMNNQKYIRIAIAAGFIAILLIFVSTYIDFSPITDSSDDCEDYCAQLETDLLSVISQIQGVGKAKIFLTMDNSGENVYLNNTDTKTKSITPIVRGVVIVCDGGDDPIVVSRVMLAVTRSLDISSNKVCITKLSN